MIGTAGAQDAKGAGKTKDGKGKDAKGTGKTKDGKGNINQ